MPDREWSAGILRGHTGACPHRISRVHANKPSPLVQPSNPEYPHMTHAVTMAVTEQQLHIMVIEAHRWLPRPVMATPRSRDTMYRYFDGGSFEKSVEWMWHRCRSGIAVSIRNGELALFVPFCNPNYTNTWSARARSLVPRVGLPPDRWWANGWTLCGDVTSKQLWGDQGVCAIQNMIMFACQYGIMSDCDFIVNKRDSSCIRLDGCDAMNPLDAYQQPMFRPPLVPVLSPYTGDQFADITMPLAADWHRTSYGSFNGQQPQPPHIRPKPILWDDKLPCASFRGSLTGSGGCRYTNQRIALLHYHNGSTLDLLATSANRRLRYCPIGRAVVMPQPGSLDVGKHNYLPMHSQQERNQFSVTLDGHSGADRLGALASGNQCILKVAPPAHALCPDTWASLRMHAWEHYVPVSSQMHDLQEKLDWAIARPDVCKRLLYNCRLWADRERADVLDWWVDATRSMSQLNYS